MTCLNIPLHGNRGLFNPRTTVAPRLGYCVDSCPSNKFLKLPEKTCEQCINGCSECTNNTDCQKCTSSKWLSADTVNAVCRTGGCACTEYPYLNGEKKCLSPCDSSCKCCQGPNSNNCFSCDSPLWLHNSSCVPQCPTNGYYHDTASRECRTCNSGCITCDGSSHIACLTCKANFYFVALPTNVLPGIHASDTATSGDCDPCPSTYIYYHDRKCLPCDASCKTCSLELSSTSCLTCQIGKVFRVSTGECLNTCPEGSF